MKILVIGESCKDVFYYGETTRLCPEAPVPVFRSTNNIENGGMAKNVQKNLHVFGATPDIITNKNWTKIKKIRYVDYRTNHMFLRVDENDSLYGSLTIDELKKHDLSVYDAIIVSDYNKGYLSTDVLAEIPKLHDLTFLDTKKLLGSWCDMYSFIKINNKEYDLTKHTLTDKINQRLVVTRGSDGSEYHGKVYQVPAVEVKDTSGAGDTFISAMATKYVATQNIIESIKFANICATSVVQKRGVSVCEK
tara:strand:+ start:674 stop:1420 length:747 start_codon:yes stop_codon:yes gene_type:complete